MLQCNFTFSVSCYRKAKQITVHAQCNIIGKQSTTYKQVNKKFDSQQAQKNKSIDRPPFTMIAAEEECEKDKERGK